MEDLVFHHARPLRFARHGVVHPASSLEDTWAREYAPAYHWLQQRCGFAPLFLAVGATSVAWDMTGFANGGDVCFSWHEPPEADALVYSDYDAWHAVLNAVDGQALRPITQLDEWRLLRPQRGSEEWQRVAQHQAVQACVPRLDLRQADVITCPNRASAEVLLARGFAHDRLRVAGYRPRRLPVAA